MKFVIYKGQKKITVDNAWVPEGSNMAKLIKESTGDEVIIENLQLHQMEITSTRSILENEHDIASEDLEKEIFEGIHWNQETVN